MCYKFRMFIDSHCHLELEEYDEDRDEAIARALEAGISLMLTVGTEPRYFPKVAEIVRRYPSVYGAIGVHPHNAGEYSDAVEQEITAFLRRWNTAPGRSKIIGAQSKIIGYGEIGLDFFRNYAPREAQIEAFGRQIEVARAGGLPIIVHSRNAEKETIEILRDARLESHPTIVHCFSYGISTARTLLDMGMYLSIPGTVTYKNSGLADIIRYVPLERILSETDAPFLTPAPHRGKRNEPAFVHLVVAEIARIKQQQTEETAEALAATFCELFGIPIEEVR